MPDLIGHLPLVIAGLTGNLDIKQLKHLQPQKVRKATEGLQTVRCPPHTVIPGFARVSHSKHHTQQTLMRKA